MAYTVFLSAANDDRDLARDVKNRLEQAGARVAMAQDIRGGEILGSAVGQAIRDADEIVLLVTSSYLQSPWTMSELGGAFSLGKAITPIVLVTTQSLPPPLRSVQTLRFPDLPKYLGNLQKRLSDPEPNPVRR
jgi:hypothetical protein